MSGRRALRVSHGVTNAGTTSRSQRRGTASAQLAARLSSRAGGPLLGSASTPALGRSRSNQPDDFNASKVDGGDSPLPPLGGWAEGVLPRPNTTTGAFGRPSSSDPGPLKELEAGESGQLFTPPRSSPGLARKDPRLTNAKGHDCSSSGNGTFSGSAARSPLYPATTTGNGGTNGDAVTVGGESRDGSSGIPLGLSKLGREDLEVYVDIVRATLAREAKKDQPAAVVDDEAIQTAAVGMAAAKAGPDRAPGRGGSRGSARSAGEGRAGGGGGGGRVRNGRRAPRRSPGDGRITGTASDARIGGKQQPGGGAGGQNRRHKNRSRSHRHHHHHYHHHHHHHQSKQRGKGPKGGSTGPSVSSTIGDDGGSEMKWFARSKGSRIVPLRTLMLDSEVNNIPHVGTQSDFRALIKAQNIPHPSYDIDGDGVVSQEDYALAKRFDINGDGILDEAEKVVGRRIMAEMFLENHQHDMHLYGQGLAQKSMTANVDDISRSRGFKKIMSGLREKEKNFVNHGSEGVKECVTLKAKSLTRHNFFSDKFDTTAWNDFTRDPRDADWLESRRHDGSRNQMYFMRKVEARESAQGKLNASYRGSDAFSTKRITLITDPAVENS